MQGNKSIWKTFKSNLPIGIILGVIVSAIFFIFELVFQPYLPEILKMSVESRNVVNTLNGIFYGGIVEELLLRWGLMSLLIWMMWKVFQRSKPTPSPAISWISIIISSILFALGHLGVNMLAALLTLLILTRMLLLNGIGGIVFGWLYWKKGLEIAMVPHAALHITTTIIMNIWFLL
ncbi:CPBP family glutamic-type intramembrane protease [Peribacillus asahii]|uniref:CPBP family glutamic-type intramembrane protease n=1 Tax=Peribacillus asahii TaxID=228899 RepID=UPI00207AACFA|nr:CPBP family glutamic-type intramembrane protease [Peribacillus asahii]USK61660.1 CPBP family intramembrane metalloprotease [Peribacillus asahii]